MIVPNYYEDLKVLHLNTMPNRAYYIPASKRLADPVEGRNQSDRFVLLSGEWEFRYFDSVRQVKEEFFKEGYDTKSFDKVTVPGVWQNYGCDRHQYVNTRYPFPMDPPYVPCANPCGAYVRRFPYHRDEKAPMAYLNFEGVDSCFYVWLNGRFIGYSQVSHSTSEFDVTESLQEGENTLCVLVLKWCDGSYLEDQDKFRMSGIFRDVYLLKRPREGIFDYFVKAAPSKDSESGDVEIRFRYLGRPVPVKVSVFDREGLPVAGTDVQPGAGTNAQSGTKAGADAQPDAGAETCPQAGTAAKSGADAQPDAGAETCPQAGTAAEAGTETEAWTEKAALKIPDAKFWNAEEPYLYTLLLETEDEVITDCLGIREIHTEKGVLYLNGAKVKFRGTNRHDSDPVTGFAISPAQLKKDLRIMKEHNINAIRTSHYPNAPWAYQLYDRYGFYVIDEADNESHGTGEVYTTDREREEGKWHWGNAIADNPEFIEATLDRTRRCVERDKNRPSVVIWSMGNECAYGCTFETALKWTKAFDPTRLTHYEGARHAPRKDCDYSNIDLHSRMYPGIGEIHAYFEKDGSLPFVMCEYCHAMGNGPGDLEDYFQAIESYEGSCGGFIWEWCDHAIEMGKTVSGKKMYAYGGEHGEFPHDGNFCMDGLVYPDRRPHTGLMEFKNVHRPARVTALRMKEEALKPEDAGQAQSVLVLHNYMDFMNLKDYLTIGYEVTCDGVTVESGSITDAALLDIPAHGEGAVPLSFTVPEKGKSFLKVSYYRKTGNEILPAGFLLGFEEVALGGSLNQKAERILTTGQGTAEQGTAQFEIEEGDCSITVSASDFCYTYDKFTGLFAEMSYGNRTLLERAMEYNIWRAPTDNDRWASQAWERAGYNRTIARAYETHVENCAEKVVIQSVLSLSAVHLQRLLNIKAHWTIWPDGTVDVSLHGEKNPSLPFLPRFGLRMFLPKAMDMVDYCGIGPTESYVDKKWAGYHGVFHSEVRALHEDYIRPQENGSHYDCDYVTVSSQTTALAIAGRKTFSFNASVYTQEELTEKAHNYQLVESPYTVLCVDHCQSGIGSGSCGPELDARYRLDGENMDFEIRMKPGKVI